MGQRTWFKIYAKNWLRGSIREESPAIRGIWVDLLALAANGEYGDIGTIQLAEDVGFTNKQIIKILKISEEEWFEAKNCLVDSERITVHNDSDVIKILNWSKYQSEYERQKPHRNQEFMELREIIKKRDNFTCQKCKKNKDELKVPLCVHHIDNNPSNNIPENLVTLCMSCHSHLSRQEFPNQKPQQESSIKEFNKKVQQKGSMGEKRIEKDLEKRDKRKEKEIKHSGQKSAHKKDSQKVLQIHQLLVEQFKKLYEQKYRATYVDTKKDFVMSAKLLKKVDLQEAERRLNNAFIYKYWFDVKTFGQFFAHFNDLIQESEDKFTGIRDWLAEKEQEVQNEQERL